MGNHGCVPQPCVFRALSGEEVRPIEDKVVKLNVYDLNKSWLETNHLLAEVLQIGGAFHAGVEVYGREYFYGDEGICMMSPKHHDVHIYRQSVLMGRVNMSSEDVGGIIESLRPEWPGQHYDILSNNCCTFARSLCRQLVGREIPEWVDRLAKLASKHGFDGLVGRVIDTRSVSSVSNSTLGGESQARRFASFGDSSCGSPLYANDLIDREFGLPPTPQSGFGGFWQKLSGKGA